MTEDSDDDIEDLLLLLAALVARSELDDSSHTDNLLRDRMSFKDRRNRFGKIRRISLLDPQESAFEKLFQSKQDDALITLCGFDHAAFGELLSLFEPLFDSYSPHSKSGFIERRSASSQGGRPRKVTSVQALALNLTWTRTRGKLSILSIIFGIVPSMISIWIRFSRRVVIKILKDHPDARVEFPDDETLATITAAITDKYPELEELGETVWAAMDGLKTLIQSSGDDLTQNKFHNGWKNAHYVNSLFLFSADGKVRAVVFNVPGVVHDSTMAEWGGVYEKVEELFRRRGVKVVVDSAFDTGSHTSLLKSYQSNVTNDGRLRQPDALHRTATSIRQLSEWGMQGFQGSFPRLQDRLLWEEKGERKLIMQSIVLLYNFRAVKVGQNQIRSTFFQGQLVRDARTVVE